MTTASMPVYRIRRTGVQGSSDRGRTAIYHTDNGGRWQFGLKELNPGDLSYGRLAAVAEGLRGRWPREHNDQIYDVVGVGTEPAVDDIYVICKSRRMPDSMLRCWTLGEFERLPSIAL